MVNIDSYTIGSDTIRINPANSYDSLELQQDLIKILGSMTSAFKRNVPEIESLSAVFKALDRISSIKGNLQYYFQLISNILQKSVYCKTTELPDFLYEVSTEPQTLPYFRAYEDLLICVNKVMRKAQKIERESISKVQELEAEVKGQKEYIKQIEKDLNNIRTFAKN